MILRTLRLLAASLAVIGAVVVAGTLTTNYLGANAAGAVPLERLARRGTANERVAARMVADSLAAGDRYTAATRWSARREVSPSGDTIRFWLYRSRDASVVGRMLRPRPRVGGFADYVVSERRLYGPAIGVH